MPPAPVHESVKVLELLKAAVDSLPELAFDPDQAPEAAQLVAFVDDHDSIDVPFALIDSGLALRSTVGAGGGGEPLTVTVALFDVVPPAPVQASV